MRRMMNWSCNCGRTWSTVLAENSTTGLPDAEQVSICDPCLDRMPGIRVAEIEEILRREAIERCRDQVEGGFATREK